MLTLQNNPDGYEKTSAVKVAKNLHLSDYPPKPPALRLPPIFH
jgi:hypothetical protein